MTERLGADEVWDQLLLPTPEQLAEYVQLMRETTYALGKGVKRLRRTRVVNGYEVTDISNKEFWLPGTMTDWSIPDKKGRTHQDRCRTYSASYLAPEFAQGVAQLVVLENDTKRYIDFAERPKYHTVRNTYRINWQEDDVVTYAHMTRGEFVSDVVAEADVRGTEIGQAQLWLDHEETEPDLFRVFEPDTVSAIELDGLLARTDAYSRDLQDGAQDKARKFA